MNFDVHFEALTIKTMQEINLRGKKQRLKYHENCPQIMESNSALVVLCHENRITCKI